MAADRQLIRSVGMGKRTDEQTLVVGHDPHDRLRPGHLPAILTDACTSDASALLEVCGRCYPLKGRGRRPRVRWRQGLAYEQVHQSSKRGRVDRVEVRAVHGKAQLEQVRYLFGYTQINTRVAERHNGTRRWRHQRRVRKTLAFSNGCVGAR